MAKITYKTQEKKKKDEHSYAGWIFLFAFLGWNTLWISIWAHEGFGFDWGGATIISLATLVLGSLFWMAAKDWEYIRTSEYTIFEFEIWDKETSQYVKRYDYGSREIYANYFLNWQTGNSETYSTEDDILNRYNDTESFSKPSGFTNKEEVMKSILDMIRSSIANKIEDQKIRIRNVSTSEVITVEELVKLVKGENQ
jgi:hypothetical protein